MGFFYNSTENIKQKRIKDKMSFSCKNRIEISG